MLNFAHLFSLCFLLLAPINNSFAKKDGILLSNDDLSYRITQGRVYLKEKALFKMNKHTYFYSDIVKSLSVVKEFKCLFHNSVFFKALKIDDKIINKILQKNWIFNKKNNKFLRKYLSKIVLKIKAEQFANSHQVIIREETLTALENKDCLDLSWINWPMELRSLVSTEIYFRNKFRINILSKQKKYKDFPSSSFESLLQNLNKKNKHEFFF